MVSYSICSLFLNSLPSQYVLPLISVSDVRERDCHSSQASDISVMNKKQNELCRKAYFQTTPHTPHLQMHPESLFKNKFRDPPVAEDHFFLKKEKGSCLLSKTTGYPFKSLIPSSMHINTEKNCRKSPQSLQVDNFYSGKNLSSQHGAVWQEYPQGCAYQSVGADY